MARLQVITLQKLNYLEQVFTGGKVELFSAYLLSERRGFAAESIFKIQMNGTGFTKLYEFQFIDDYDSPVGSLLLSDSTLYGRFQSGAIFKIQTDGSDYSKLVEYYDQPIGSLIISGSTLYGMTKSISQFDRYGTIFKIQTDGSGFTVLHEFNEWPSGSPCISGSTLYGMTSGNYAFTGGTLFKIKTDGSDYSVLHKFSGGPEDGSMPTRSLIISDSTIYGMTDGGGIENQGTIFKIQINGSGFSLLHTFIGGADYGPSPSGALILSGSALYGMTTDWNGPHSGMIFTIQTDGSGYTVLHEFSGGSDDGSFPCGSLILSGSTFFGMTNKGGSSDMGVVFSLKMSLDLQVERHEARAFSIMRQYGQIQFLDGDAGVQVAQYRIMRRKGTADFLLLRTVTPSELQNNQFQLQDKYLEKDITYTYRVEAYDASGQLIGISLEKTI